MAKVAAAGLDWDTALTYWQTVVRLLARDGDGYWRLARCAGQMMVMLNVAVGGAARALLGQERVTEVAAWLYPGQQAGLGVAVGWAHLAAGLQLTEEGQHAAAAVQYEAASKYAEDRGGPAEALHRHAQALHHQLDDLAPRVARATAEQERRDRVLQAELPLGPGAALIGIVPDIPHPVVSRPVTPLHCTVVCCTVLSLCCSARCAEPTSRRTGVTPANRPPGSPTG